MRHRKKGKKLSRKIGPRKALERNLIISLISYEKINTTEEKAKFIKPRVEKIITIGKQKNLTSKRRLNQLLTNKKAEKKVREVLSERYKDRAGGYTRILKIGKRLGDGARITRIEFV